MGLNIYATENTHYFYKTHNIDTTLINESPNACKLIESGIIHFVVNIPSLSVPLCARGTFFFFL